MLPASSPVSKTELTPDLIMRREALCGASMRGPTTLTVIWPLKFVNGYYFSPPLCEQTLHILTQMHPNLKSAFQVQNSQVKWFKLEPLQFQITTYHEDGTPNYWRSAVKRELRKPFDDPNLPSWRVAIVFQRGIAADKQNKINMLFTALHALCDGVCLSQLAVTFNDTLAKLHLGIPVSLKSPEDVPLEVLYQKFPQEPSSVSSSEPPQQFHPCETGFAIHALKKFPGLVDALRGFCHQHDIRMHGALFAAEILAIKKVRNPPDAFYQALTITSFRELMGASKQLLRPLFSWLKIERVNPNQSFLEIAKFIDRELHAQIDAGKHVENLKRSEAQLRNNPTPEELLSQVRLPHNLLNLTNRQELGSSGNYPEGSSEPIIKMNKIFGFGGNSAYFGLQGAGGFGLTVGVTTFRKTFFCSASCIEDTRIGLGEEMSEEVLRGMEDILIENVK